jgi:hypothetical protein
MKIIFLSLRKRMKIIINFKIKKLNRLKKRVKIMKLLFKKVKKYIEILRESKKLLKNLTEVKNEKFL